MAKKSFLNSEAFVTWIVARSVKDSAFRSRLLADPRRTIEGETGLTVPAGVRVDVVEEGAERVVLTLPRAAQ